MKYYSGDSWGRGVKSLLAQTTGFSKDPDRGKIWTGNTLWLGMKTDEWKWLDISTELSNK